MIEAVDTVRTIDVRRDGEPTWEARRIAAEAVQHLGKECVDAVSVVVSELVENVVKYGGRRATPTAGTLRVTVTGTRVCVRVTNEVDAEEDGRRVEETLNRITAARDVAELYEQRLRQLYDNAALPRTQLGLLRIAFEARFHLSASFHPPELEIVAERTFAPPGGEP